MNSILKSEPTFSGFSPDFIPYQRQVIDLIRDYDYSLGNLEILLSGSYGSAKSILLAHIAIRHCLEFPKSRVCVARRALPDVKKTIWREITDHMGDDLIEGKHYTFNRSEMVIRFRNGSEIVAASWADRKYSKFRSLKFSMLIIEEIVENDDQDEVAFNELKARLRRLPHVKQNVLLAATNPGPPTHWVYRYFIAPTSHGRSHVNRFVFYSKTYENPFMDPVYVAQLKRDMPKKEALRYLEGQWIEIKGEVVYYEYVSEDQYRPKIQYIPRLAYPIYLSFDFNIADGKPMSAIMGQFIDDEFHFFNEAVIEGGRTANIIEQWHDTGKFDMRARYILTGDAAGKARDTRNIRSDYDIIKDLLGKIGLNFEYKVPLANPAIRTRHNKVNAYCRNGENRVRMFLYQGCETADEGMKLTKLKPGADYVEDDSKRHQHITTAMGYLVMTALASINERKSRTRDM